MISNSYFRWKSNSNLFNTTTSVFGKTPREVLFFALTFLSQCSQLYALLPTNASDSIKDAKLSCKLFLFWIWRLRAKKSSLRRLRCVHSVDIISFSKVPPNSSWRSFGFCVAFSSPSILSNNKLKNSSASLCSWIDNGLPSKSFITLHRCATL